jgi:hypothetical protein
LSVRRRGHVCSPLGLDGLIVVAGSEERSGSGALAFGKRAALADGLVATVDSDLARCSPLAPSFGLALDTRVSGDSRDSGTSGAIAGSSSTISLIETSFTWISRVM